MADDKKIKRLFKIYQRLKRGPVTIEGLKQWCNENDNKVSKRTLYRDLEDISLYFETDSEKIIVENGEFNKTTWRLINKKDIILSSDSASDLLQKFFLIKNFSPGAISSIIGDSVEKLADNLVKTDINNAKFIPFETLQNAIFSTNWGECNYDLWEKEIVLDVIWAIENKRQVVISKVQNTTTESADIPNEIKVNPLKIFYHRGTIYLCFEWQEKPGDILLYDLEGITDFKLTDQRFKPSNTTEKINIFLAKRFGVSDSKDQKTYTVKLLFPRTTHYKFVLKRFWHPTQKFYQMKTMN